jgi:hypothetical protein
LLDTHDRGHRSVKDHVTLDEAHEEVEIHDEPASDSKQWGELVTEENKHVVKQVGNWLSIRSLQVDKQSNQVLK